ncbi:MAG: hypothetical protein R3330_03265 [Saprospiraceae bacterium]|nr:hypothetical protein [Saprospiraceae bacterium]
MEKKKKLISKAVDWIRSRGFGKIRANVDEFETPTNYSAAFEEDVFVPDVTAVKRGKKSYVEIALKTDNIRRTISKWKLLSTLANRKGGKLFLLAPRGHKAFAERIVKTHHLRAKVVYLNG